MKVSIIVPVLNSHEIVRRQILHFKRMNLPDDVEIIYLDDGSKPPLSFPDHGLKNFIIWPTNDFREWTWPVARNKGAHLAKGEYLLMTDIDYIIPLETINVVREFTGDKMRFKREFGILDEDGNFSQDIPILLKYGLSPERIPTRGVQLAPHSNNFAMRKELFWEIGGYTEERIGWAYPQREDALFKTAWIRYIAKGMAKDSNYRPLLYMFPNGQYCGDVDYNPFGLFHSLSRKSERNEIFKRHNSQSV